MPKHELLMNVSVVEELAESSRIDVSARRDLLDATLEIRRTIDSAKDEDLLHWNYNLIRCLEEADVIGGSDLSQASVKKLIDCISKIKEEAAEQDKGFWGRLFGR